MKKILFFMCMMLFMVCFAACAIDGEEKTIDVAQKEAEIIEVSATEKNINFFRDNIKIFGKLYLPEGEGTFPAVILSNGYPGSYTEYQTYAQSFAENGIAGIVFDFSCTNNASEGEFGDMSVLTQAADLNVVLDVISALPEIDSNHVFLWGHSFGGLTATYVAAQRKDEVKGLIVLEPSYQMHDQYRQLYPEGSEIPEYTYTPQYVGKAYVEDLLSFDIYDMMPDYDNKVMLFMGTANPAEVMELQTQYFEKAAGKFTSMQLVRVEGADHGFKGDGGQKMMKLAIEFINENID